MRRASPFIAAASLGPLIRSCSLRSSPITTTPSSCAAVTLQSRSLFALSASLCAPTTAASRLLIGNEKNGKMKTPIHVQWTDIVGLESAAPGTRLSGGRVLSMLDMCAARAAQHAADFASRRTGLPYLCCTVGVTNTIFRAAILHGDVVRMAGRVIHCGGSSVTVHISVYRRSYSSRREILAGESYFTMVVITPDLKAAHVVPAMELTDPQSIELHHQFLSIRKITCEAQAAAAQRREKQTLDFKEVSCPINEQKAVHVKIDDTKITGNRIFFSSFLNNNNTVFGGELMAWMERHAVNCGRCFCTNRHVYCIGMHSVAFPEPVFASDWVTLDARVIYVRRTTMEVDVTLRAERRESSENGGVITNKASFVLVNSNDIGVNEEIPIGIRLDEKSTQEELQLFMDAKERYHISMNNSATFKAKQLHERVNSLARSAH